jgi:GNAT superfamily N-acetyltransferase
MSRGIDFQVSGDCHKHDGITIRRAKQVDKGAIWQVHVRAIKEVCKTHYSERELKMWTEVLKPDRYEEQISDPEHLRQGVGIKILQALENEALDSGLKRLCLTSSLNAVGFYEMAGYRPQRQKRWLLPSEMVVCVTMTKELA